MAWLDLHEGVLEEFAERAFTHRQREYMTKRLGRMPTEEERRAQVRRKQERLRRIDRELKARRPVFSVEASTVAVVATCLHCRGPIVVPEGTWRIRPHVRCALARLAAA